MDPSALSFLVRRAVEDRKREEEEKERKREEAQEKADLELAKRDPWWAQHLADKKARSSRHKRKKKRKKRLPGSSPLPPRVSAGTLGVGEDWRIYPVFPQYPLVRVLPALLHGPVCSADHGDSSVVGFSLRSLVSGSHLFAVLLGLTVDTCYVSLQRLLWEIAENVSFSAQCLVRHWISEMTSWSFSYSAQCLVRQWLWEITSWSFSYSAQCLVRQWLWEMTSWKCSYSAHCLVRHWIQYWEILRFCIQRLRLDSGYMVLPAFHRCSSWMRLSCPLCVTTYALVQLLFTVEVPQVQLIIKVIYIPVAVQSLITMALTVQQTIEIPRLQFFDKELTCPLLGHTGLHHSRRCAETGSHGLTVQQTTEILLFQYIDKVFDDLVVHSAGAGDGRDSAVNCGGSAVGAHRLA